MEQEQLTPEEKRAFETLVSSAPPPTSLEYKIIAQLKEEGLIKKQTTMNVYLKYATAVAASLIIFLTGNYIGKQSSPTEINPLNGYIMILKEDHNFTPGEPMQMFKEYAAWMNNLYDQGVKITGQELKNEAIRVSALGPEKLGGDEDKITGYFIIEAKSEAEAMKIVNANPHLKYGGIIELKEFMNR